MNRQRKLRIAILRILKQAHDLGHLVREDNLQNELTLSVRPAPMTSETAMVIQSLDEHKHLITVRDEELVRFGISPLGEAWLIQELTA